MRRSPQETRRRKSATGRGPRIMNSKQKAAEKPLNHPAGRLVRRSERPPLSRRKIGERVAGQIDRERLPSRRGDGSGVAGRSGATVLLGMIAHLGHFRTRPRVVATSDRQAVVRAMKMQIEIQRVRDRAKPSRQDNRDDQQRFANLHHAGRLTTPATRRKPIVKRAIFREPNIPDPR